MVQNSLRLYVDAQFTSPYAMSVFVALCEKGVPFEVATVNLGASENQEAGYVRKSLTRRIPTLEQGDFSLSESSAIDEYIEDTFHGPALYPDEPRKKARARQIQAWLRSDLMPLREERPTEVLFYGMKGKPLSAAAQKAVEKLVSVAETLLLPDAEYLFGEWSIADVDLALMLNRLALHGDPLPERLAAYARRQWQRPSVQKWVNQVRPPL